MGPFLSLNYSSLIGRLPAMTSVVAGMLKGAQGVGGGGGYLLYRIYAFNQYL